jgi:hypothetical protein
VHVFAAGSEDVPAEDPLPARLGQRQHKATATPADRLTGPGRRRPRRQNAPVSAESATAVGKARSAEHPFWRVRIEIASEQLPAPNGGSVRDHRSQWM